MSVTPYSPSGRPQPQAFTTPVRSSSEITPTRLPTQVKSLTPDIMAHIREILKTNTTSLSRAQERWSIDASTASELTKTLQPTRSTSSENYESKTPARIVVRQQFFTPKTTSRLNAIDPTLPTSFSTVLPRDLVGAGKQILTSPVYQELGRVIGAFPSNFSMSSSADDSPTVLLSPTAAGTRKIKDTVEIVKAMLSADFQRKLDEELSSAEAKEMTATTHSEDYRTPHLRRAAMGPSEAKNLLSSPLATRSTKRASRLKSPLKAQQLIALNSIKKIGAAAPLVKKDVTTATPSVRKTQQVANTSLMTPARGRTNSVKKVPSNQVNTLESKRLDSAIPKRFYGGFAIDSFSAVTTPRATTTRHTAAPAPRAAMSTTTTTSSTRESKIGHRPFTSTVRASDVPRDRRLTYTNETAHDAHWEPKSHKDFFGPVFKHLPRSAETGEMPSSFTAELVEDRIQLVLTGNLLPADAIKELKGVKLTSEEGNQLAVLLTLLDKWGVARFNAFFSREKLTLGDGAGWKKILFTTHPEINEDVMMLGDKCTFSNVSLHAKWRKKGEEWSMFCSARPWMEDNKYVGFGITAEGSTSEQIEGQLGMKGQLINVERINLKLINNIEKMDPSSITSAAIALMAAKSRR